MNSANKLVRMLNPNEWQKRKGTKRSQFDLDLFQNDEWLSIMSYIGWFSEIFININDKNYAISYISKLPD